MKVIHSIGVLFMSIVIAMLLYGAFERLTAGDSPVGEVAIKGYDPVEYYTNSRAIKGNGTFAFQWHNLTWYFLTKENKDLFAAAPDKYIPQYDGYCAWALTESRKALTDPTVWKIVNGKLYLNCSQTAFEKWSRDIPGNIRKADEIWLKLKNGK